MTAPTKDRGELGDRGELEDAERDLWRLFVRATGYRIALLEANRRRHAERARADAALAKERARAEAAEGRCRLLMRALGRHLLDREGPP